MPRIVIKRTPGRLQASLREFAATYPRAVVIDVLRPWGKDVVRTAQRTRTYTDRTGNLREKMDFSVNRSKLTVGVYSRARSKKRRFPYWRSQEFGSKNGVRAKHFIRDAMLSNFKNLENQLRNATRDAGRRSGF